MLALDRRDIDAYRAAYHLPGVSDQPEYGADSSVLASLLAMWTRQVALMLDLEAIAQQVELAPPVRLAVDRLLDAGRAGDEPRLERQVIAALQLPDEDLYELLFAMAVGFTRLGRLCGGLTNVDEVYGFLDTLIGPHEQVPGVAAVMVTAAVGAANWAGATRILQVISVRDDGPATLATMLAITIKAAARVLAGGPAGPAVDEHDTRFPAPPDGSALPERAVRLVRQAVAGHLGADGVPPPAQLLQLPDTAHAAAAMLYAAQTFTAQLPVFVQHVVDVEAAALDPDNH